MTMEQYGRQSAGTRKLDEGVRELNVMKERKFKDAARAASDALGARIIEADRLEQRKRLIKDGVPFAKVVEFWQGLTSFESAMRFSRRAMRQEYPGLHRALRTGA